MRATTHRISESGILPFAPTSSTIGVFAKNLSVMKKIAGVLLSSYPIDEQKISRIYLLEDAFAIANQEVNKALQPYISALKEKTNINISSRYQRLLHTRDG